MSDKGWLLPDVIDPPTVCFQINVPDDPNHVRAFIGALNELARWWNWERDDLKRGAPVSAVWARQITEAMELWNSGGACNVPIDCEELEACLVLSPVMTASNQQAFNQQQAQIQNQHQQYTDAWDGSNQSINPNAPNSYPATAQGELALCKALELIIDDYIQRKLILLKIANGILAVGDILLGALFTPFQALGILAEGTLTPNGQSVASHAVSTAIMALEDQDAVNDVICCAKDALNGGLMSEATWNTALGSCGFTVGSFPAIVRDFVDAEVFQVQSNFFLMIDTWTEVDAQITLGVDYTCVCGGAWSWSSDFDSSQNIWQPIAINPPYDSPRANWAFGTGWSFADTQVNVDDYRRSCSITCTFPATQIDSLQMVWDLTKGTYDIATTVLAVRFNLNGVQQSIQTFPPAGISNGTDKVYNFTGTLPVTADEILIFTQSSAQTPPSYDGLVKIKSLALTGVGINPFGI